MENLTNTKQQKRLFKMYIKTKLYLAQIFHNNLVVIRKSKLALKLNKPAYFEWNVYFGIE